MSQPEPARRVPDGFVGRDLPHDVAAEQALLGAFLLEEAAFDQVQALIDPADFYLLPHQAVYEACRDLAKEGRAIDPVLVAQRLDARGLLGTTVPREMPFALSRGIGTAANVEHYAEVVKGQAQLRRMMQVAQRVASRGYEAGASVQEFLQAAEKEVFDAAQRRTVDTLRPIGEAVDRAIDSLSAVQQRVRAGHSPITGVPTGMASLDAMLLGLQAGQLVVLAARPSVGKTALALNWTVGAATRHGKTVAFFSLEMAAEQLSLRMLASEAKLSWRQLSTGHFGNHDWDRITAQGERLHGARIWLDDNFVLSPVDLRSRCRRIKAQAGGLDLVVVDYLQLMHAPGIDSREQQIAWVSRSLKALAKEMGCPVLALSQLSRAVEKRRGEPPMLSDLRESGAIEQDADVVLFLHRPGEDKEGDPAPNAEVQEIELIVAKQRQGPTGSVPLVFFRNHTLFAEKQRGA